MPRKVFRSRSSSRFIGTSDRELYKGLPGAFLETYTLDGKGRTPAKGDIFKNPGAREDPAPDRRERPRRFITKARSRTRSTRSCRRTAATCAKPISKSTPRTWVDPVSVNYRGYDVFELPPNGQGIADAPDAQYPRRLRSEARWVSIRPPRLHAMIEAKKLAWADRAKFYADPAFSKIPLAGLLSKPYAAERRKLIDPDRAARKSRAGQSRAERWRHDLHVHRR